MIKHCLKLAWNRKRDNALIILEICVSFLVLFSITLLTCQFFVNYRKPLGFDYVNVLSVYVDAGDELATSGGEGLSGKDQVETLLNSVRDLPEVEAISASYFVPYFGGMTTYTDDGIIGLKADDAFDEVMRLSITEGRWFQREDDQLNWIPVVVNRQLAETRFGSESPLGRVISPPSSEVESRVVGVIDHFRRKGDFSTPESLGFWRVSLTRDLGEGQVPYLLIRLQPGVPVSFEADLEERLMAIAPEWSFEIDPLWRLRESYLSLSVSPLIAGGLIISFLLLMVALGLLGVLWMTVSKRTCEIGLRLAHGASTRDIFLLIVIEVMAMTSIGVFIGGLIASQVQVFEVIGSFDWSTYTVSVLLSVLLIFGLTLTCALYPGWMAASVHPVEALHHE